MTLPINDLGHVTTEKQSRTKGMDMDAKLSEKNLFMMEEGKGNVDKDLGMITPGSMVSGAASDIKQEVPSLEKLQNVVKETQKSQLDLDFSCDRNQRTSSLSGAHPK